jgi:uncharacterized membrane protein YbhN (UPF0104 family)
MPVDLHAPTLRELWRRGRVPALVLAVVVVVALVAGGPAQAFVSALDRVVSANPAWALAAAAFEVASFAGYIALLGHVARSDRFGWRESYRTTLAGAAATRLLPTAGAGGAALTLWVLRKAGRDASRTLFTFLILLYAVFLGALLAAGLGAAEHGPIALIPAGLAAAAILAAPVVAHFNATFGGALRDALAHVRRPHPRLLGALGWWTFDCAVLWAAFHAVGAPPALSVLVLGYFLGQVANTIPLPGAASSGMIGVFVAFGVDADLALAGVLAYRAIAIWLPAPAGLHALAGLKRTVATWSDAPASATADVPCETPPCGALQPLAA